MGDDDGGGSLEEQVLEERDAVDVEVIGRLIEQQELRLERECQCECRSLALAARARVGAHGLVEPEAMQEFDQPDLGVPAQALVPDAFESAPQGEALAQGRCRRQLGFLLDERNRESIAPPDLAAVEGQLARDDFQETRLAGAVAADEADALA